MSSPFASYLSSHGLFGQALEAGGAPLARERHAEAVQQRERLRVGLRRRRERHVQPAHLVDRVVVDLGEDDLLADAHRVVAAAVEAARVEAAEVADARDRDRHEPIEELVRALVPQRAGHADGHPLTQLEVRDRLPRPANVRLLAGDGRELRLRRLEHVRVLLGLAHAHVEHDLLDPRRLHRRRVLEALDELGSQLLLVALLEASVDGHYSITVPERSATRLRSPSSRVTPSRVGLPSLGSTSATFETWMGPSRSTMPPSRLDWRWVSRSVCGRIAFLMM